MRRVSRTYEAHLTPLGITPVQFYVLSSLFETDEIKFKVLAGKLGMEGPTLTGILDRLARMDYIERRDDPEDRRSLLICLTKEAKKHRDVVVGLVDTLDNELKKEFDEAEFAAFIKILEKIGEN
ncbi:MAG: MarR family transcriptional regulator [Negativicutes bacterium]|nr:MarR family transcriptional regulator [Negativicutes bacterium]